MQRIPQAERKKGYRQATPKATNTALGEGFRTLGTAVKRYTFIGATALVLLGACYLGGEKLHDFFQRPVNAVHVKGDFHYVSRKRARKMINSAINNDFMNIDLTRLKKALEAHSWIAKAVVARRWPSTLEVKLIEQVPIARWGDEGFLNQRGEVVATKDTAALKNLPRLYGQEQKSSRIMRQYQDLSSLLRSRHLTIAKLWVDKLNTWRLTLAKGTEIVLGKNELLEKMRRFVAVYDQYLAAHFDAVARVDLRYANGLSVGWAKGYDVAVKEAS